jgi:hypothetical protein
MNTNRLSRTLLIAALGSVALVGCKKEQAPAPAPAAEQAPAPMAEAPAPTVSVLAVTLGNAAGPDNKIANPTTTFAPNDTIYAAVDTRTSDPAANVPGTLTAKWSHVDSSQIVHEESKALDFSGDGTTTFQISKPDGWPSGRYKVEISLDGNVVSTSDFEVK